MPPPNVTAPPQEESFGRSLGRFSLRVALGTALALGGLYLVFHDRARTLQLSEGPSLPLPEAPAPETTAGGPPPAASAAQPSAMRAEVERLHAANALGELRRTPNCPGGDLRRVAWVDAAQRVRKLTRERSGGVRVEEWFDEGGQRVEARVRAGEGARAWTRHVLSGPAGDRVEDRGPPPEVPPPPLVTGDPTLALFAGCGR